MFMLTFDENTIFYTLKCLYTCSVQFTINVRCIFWEWILVPWSISLSFWWHHTLLNVVALQKFLYKEIWVLQLYSFFLNNVMAFINFYKEIRWDFRGLCLICRSVWKYCHSKMACLLMETWDEFLYCVHSVVSDSLRPHWL